MYVYIDRQIDMQNVLHHIYYILFMCVYHIISNIQNVLNVKIFFIEYVFRRQRAFPLHQKKKRRALPLRMLISTFVQGIGFRLLVQGVGFSIQLLSLRFRDIYIYIYAYIHKHIHIHVYTHIYMRVCLCVRVCVYIRMYVYVCACVCTVQAPHLMYMSVCV